MGIRMEDLDYRFMNKLQTINETDKSMKRQFEINADVNERFNEMNTKIFDMKRELLEQI